jgi:hypothetical protein
VTERELALQKVKAMLPRPETLAAYIQSLALQGLFDSPVQSRDVIREVRNRFGRRFPVSYVQTYMKPFLREGVLRGEDSPNKEGNVWCGAWVTGTELAVRTAAERLRFKADTRGWNPEVTEDFRLGLICYSSGLWKPSAVMVRRAYEGALALRYGQVENREPEKEGICPKCRAKFGRRPMSITDLHYWAAGKGQVREKMEGLSMLLKDLGAGGAHPTKSAVIDADTAEIILKCGEVLLADLYRKKAGTGVARGAMPSAGAV